MKYVVTYESADNVAVRAPEHMAAHVACFRSFVEDGSLLMIGTFADPQQDGAMGVFTTREAAEAFASTDPFVLHGVVKSYRIMEWNEILWDAATTTPPA